MRYDADVTNPDSGQFDMSFDASAVNVTGVDFGSIGSNTVQLECWTLVDSGTVRVLFNLNHYIPQLCRGWVCSRNV